MYVCMYVRLVINIRLELVVLVAIGWMDRWMEWHLLLSDVSRVFCNANETNLKEN